MNESFVRESARIEGQQNIVKTLIAIHGRQLRHALRFKRILVVDIGEGRPKIFATDRQVIIIGYHTTWGGLAGSLRATHRLNHLVINHATRQELRRVCVDVAEFRLRLFTRPWCIQPKSRCRNDFSSPHLYFLHTSRDGACELADLTPLIVPVLQPTFLTRVWWQSSPPSGRFRKLCHVTYSSDPINEIPLVMQERNNSFFYGGK